MNATVKIENIPPVVAQKYLAVLMEGQRPLREGHVLRLATELEQNNWHLTSDAILFVKNKLANGQHRLQAVLVADKAADFLVMRTDDEDVYKVLDAGVGRTPGDALHSMGITLSKEVASAAAIVVRYDRKALTVFGSGGNKNGDITRTNIIDYVEEHQSALEKEATEVVALAAGKRMLPASLGTAFLHLANRGGKGDGLTFIRSVYLGGTQDASHDLRERLIRNKDTKYKLPRDYVFAILIKSFRSYINGSRPGVLKVIEGEKYPSMP